LFVAGRAGQVHDGVLTNRLVAAWKRQ